MKFAKIAVLGQGSVGRLASRLLHEAGFTVVAFDARQCPECQPFEQQVLDVSYIVNLEKALASCDAVLSCLPSKLNAVVATAAHARGLHYFDITDDVPTIIFIRKLGETAKGVLMPHCGVAPGLVGIAGSYLARSFETVRSIKIRVGALPQHPTELLGYAFNRSPEAVVNEYLNDCEVIEEGEQMWVAPMDRIETVYVCGTKLEAFTSSGGLGTMGETFKGRVENLDYKTMRYPGHVALMNFFFHELLMRDHREMAGRILTNAKPPVEDDVVYVDVSAEGQIEGKLQRREFVRSFYPKVIVGERRTAIVWTKSASVCAIIELVQSGKLPARGFVKQEDVRLDDFLSTSCGKLFGVDALNI